MEAQEAPLAVPIELEEVEEAPQVDLRLLPSKSGPLDEVPVRGQRLVDREFEDPHVVPSIGTLCVDEQLEGPLLFSM